MGQLDYIMWLTDQEGREQEVLGLVDDVIAGCEREFGPQSLEAADAHRLKVSALGDVGRVADARAHFDAVLPGFVAAGKRAGDAVPMLRTSIGRVLSKYGDCVGGWEQHKLAYAQRKARGGDMAFVSAVNMAAELAIAGGYEQAEAWLRGLADEVIAIPNLSNRLVADSARRSNLAFALNGLGLHAEAEENARLAADGFALTWGPDSDGVRTARANLAAALVGLGRAVEAEREIRPLIEFRRVADDSIRPELAGLYVTLGESLAGQGRLDEATAELRKAVDIGCATQGASGGRTVAAVVALADVLTSMDRWDEARGLLETAVRSGEADARRGNPWLAVARARLAANTPGA